ncbi:MAG: threonine synthase [Gemmatimonadetes bacterium]|uniref:Threonine synthase n=1 Tax=Candidatus Kutchimonas denitrificans TaxID=3056748 RepID=A0AAE4Z921_9BACT|nr:threonine synthase [Gemmatimonadota bacterium]NIR75268.1 threonine synthase [Candidatus Kutchimonas denitrificans]NIS00206.1 threonine synthase [Gemmatimonadota bacterium]NIT65798.1 threonine synthase [Gemmatimonadota bacterium]NIU53076.1 threonine synthase [Gemmatimonadota bacterium]
MKLEHTLICSRCEREESVEGTPGVCPECGAPLLARYPLDRVGARWKPKDLAGRGWDMWRYREVMPVAREEEPISLGEGGTPLLEFEPLAREAGVAKLLVKEEGLNPTGSFKARGMSAAVTRAAAGGAKGFVTPSAGNAAGALSAYGARAGIPVRVYMPADTPPVIIAECRALGANVRLIDGLITDCGVEARAFAADSGYFDVSTLREPYRVEGKKTMGYELCEQLGWRIPDAILYPTGGGTGIIGMWKAFAELEALGWIEAGRRPRMYVVQSAGCAPIVRAWEAGAESADRWVGAETLAAGLRVPAALGDFLILRALRESGGAAVAVTDTELMRASRRLRHHGLPACPEGGATLAGLHAFRAEEHIGPEDRVVLFNTGAWLKYLV